MNRFLFLVSILLAGCSADHAYRQPLTRAEVVMPPEYVGWWQDMSSRNGPWNMHISRDGIIRTFAAPTWQSIPNPKTDTPGIRYEFFPLEKKDKNLSGIIRSTSYDPLQKKWDPSFYEKIYLKYDPEDGKKYLRLNVYRCDIKPNEANSLSAAEIIELARRECDSEDTPKVGYSSSSYNFLRD